MKLVNFNDKEILKKELDNDHVIAFPTETVFGLGANSFSKNAFENLVKIKNRRPDKPFTLMCHSIKQVEHILFINDIAKKIIEKFMPGSITLLLEAKENIDYHLHLNSKFIGIRIPDNKELLDFLKFYGKPLLVPSANKADEAPATSVKEVFDYFEGEIEYCVIGKCNTNIPSTIIKIEGNEISIIRKGPVGEEEIREVLK